MLKLRHAIFVAVLGLVSNQAAAATYYIRSDGNDANTGTSNAASGAWRTVSKANSTLRPGDIVNIISVNSADTASASTNIIRPSVSGTNLAGGAGRIIYQGNPASPQGLPVYRIELLQRSYITIRGLRVKSGYLISGQINGAAATYNVIENCIIAGTAFMRGAQFCRVSSNVMRLQPSRGFAAVYFAGADDVNGQPWCHKDTLSFNHIDLGLTGGDHRTFFVRGYTNNCLIANNRMTTICSRAGSPDVSLTAYVLSIMESFANHYRDNRYDFEFASALDSPGGYAALAVRSGTHHNLFERDSLFFGVNSSLELPNSGISLGQQSGLPPDSQQVHSNVWRGCFFKAKNTAIWFHLRMANCVIENTVFVNQAQPALIVSDGTGVTMSNSIIRHCTFYSRDASAIEVGARVGISGVTVESNIFYSGPVSQCSQGVAEWPNANANTNRNLYYASSGPAGAAFKVGSSCYTVGPGSSACTALGDECNSLWGNPMLANTSLVGFNPALLPGSPAIGAQFVDGYAGAIPGIDAVAPGQVTSLGSMQVGDVSAILRWNAPGDDGQNGTATSYDLRWSLQPINDGNFASATPLLPPPLPLGAGTQQTYVMLGLTPGTTYYVALKARDDVNNLSPLSNVHSFTTSVLDQTAPAAVGDLGTP